jgi:hypothetical protein
MTNKKPGAALQHGHRASAQGWVLGILFSSGITSLRDMGLL